MSKNITPSAGSPFSKLLGVGSYRGSRIVTNEEMCNYIDSSDEWIQQRTGIVERRWATEDETVLYMGAAAGRKALANAKVAADQIDTVLVTTVSYHHPTPSLAAYLARELGCPKAATFDISAACAGFSYAITIADSLIRSGAGKHVLIVSSEKLSEITDLTDRSTAFLFSDGAGAVVLGPSEAPTIGAPIWGSYADQLDAITTESWPQAAKAGHGSVIHMEGQAVYRWATTEIATKALAAVEAAGLTPQDIDCFIPHQANNRITEGMCRRLKLPESVKVSHDIALMGNSSSASIPIAMDAMLSSGEAKSGDTTLVIGYGAGLVYAGQVLVLP